MVQLFGFSKMHIEEKMWRPWDTYCCNSKDLLTTILVFMLLYSRQVAVNATASIQSVSGMLYAENFTYYKLNGDGWLRLELHSVQGDVDLYVSGLTLNPSFSDYEMKSDTCGVDVVDIHSSVKRPVGIGIYGHPFYVQSVYKLDIQVMQEIETDEYERLFKTYHYYDGEEASKDKSKINSGSKSGLSSDSEEEEESIWWNILITILKFILEVLV